MTVNSYEQTLQTVDGVCIKSERLPEAAAFKLKLQMMKFANGDAKYYTFHIPFSHIIVPLLSFIFILVLIEFQQLALKF